MAPRSKIPRSNWGKITAGGMGGFLDPPGYPTHTHSVRSAYGHTFSMSLDEAAESDWLDDETRRSAKSMLKSWKPDRNSPETIDWMKQVMGYFRGMYNRSGSWDVSKLKSEPGTDAVVDQDNHAGVHHIRKFYPSFKLTREMMEGAYWGTKPSGSKYAVSSKPAAKKRSSRSSSGLGTMR